MSVVWGAACRARPDQPVSGDTYLVEERADGLLVAVIDALGHGPEAARATQVAERALRDHDSLPLPELIRHAHTALHGTRGVVVGVLWLEPDCHARFIGVGNVGAQVYSRQSIKPISKNGILGYRLPNLLELHYTYDPGDTFVLYSDGISGRFALDSRVDIRQPPQQLADQIMNLYGKQNDDATVVVVKTAASV